MMDTHITQRLQRTWHFFGANAAGLLLSGLGVFLGSLLIIPGPWLALNLLQETLECVRTGRTVRWQAIYERKGNFLRSWALALLMGVPMAIGYMLLLVPGVILSLLWLHAPALVADGRTPLQALSESYRMFLRRKDWQAYLLNGLVLMTPALLTRLSVLTVIFTQPLFMAYLVSCYTDEVDQAPATLPRREVLV